MRTDPFGVSARNVKLYEADSLRFRSHQDVASVQLRACRLAASLIVGGERYAAVMDLGSGHQSGDSAELGPPPNRDTVRT